MYHDQQNIYIQIKSTFIPINHPQEIKKNLMQYLQQGRIHATYDGLEILSNYTTITVPITQEHKQWINKKAIETGKHKVKYCTTY